ncbi:hypothetical protein EYF80_006962 [Liparis tanakae]|uniref:Uncharacterized protein n=1 Tax=Liparis tanakae TaxID=230148 RepID=A0A4Z2IY80_9TELE|nr:hypothetical protein EYF80_006962 [Liparis tanakae]
MAHLGKRHKPEGLGLVCLSRVRSPGAAAAAEAMGRPRDTHVDRSMLNLSQLAAALLLKDAVRLLREAGGLMTDSREGLFLIRLLGFRSSPQPDNFSAVDNYLGVYLDGGDGSSSPSCYVTKNSGGLFIQRTAGGTRYIYYNGRFKERGKADQEGEIVLEV